MANISHLTQKQNDATAVTQLAVEACTALKEYEPYIFAASIKTCSIYIKFRVTGLTTLRISNHTSSRYAYKWNLRVGNFKDKIGKKQGKVQYHANAKNKKQFFKFMLDSAK